MENKKQTAIEWLFEQFNNQDIPFGSHLFKEAKELEKQQVIEAFYDGKDIDCRFENAVEYYKETYGKE